MTGSGVLLPTSPNAGQKMSARVSEVLAKYQRLPRDQRTRELRVDREAVYKARRKQVPDFPEGSVVVRGYSLLPQPKLQGGSASTQTDTIWIKKEEQAKLVPSAKKPGHTLPVPSGLQSRLFRAIGIDFTEGSNPGLSIRDSELNLELVDVKADGSLVMSLRGWAQMGVPFDPRIEERVHPRGSQIWVAGEVVVDEEAKRIDQFDVVGIGQAWGRKERRWGRTNLNGHRIWDYAIVWELGALDKPVDMAPPCSFLHYYPGELRRFNDSMDGG